MTGQTRTAGEKAGCRRLAVNRKELGHVGGAQNRERAHAIHRLREPAGPQRGLSRPHFITVRSVARSRTFYSEVLGGQVVLEENPCIIKLANSWVLMNPGGPPPPTSPTSRS
jgi:hypothetical protein